MSGGGSQQTTTQPWGPSQPYLMSILGDAQKLYGQQASLYQNPAGNFNYGAATGALGNLLTGQPDYTAVKGAISAADQQQWNDLNNSLVPQLNARASFLGNPTGALKDLNWAVGNIGQNQSLNAQQAYLGQYDLAKQNQLSALQLYPGLAQMPNSALQDYANAVRTAAGNSSTTNTSLQPGGGQTAANIIGGLVAGTGLVNNIGGAYKTLTGDTLGSALGMGGPSASTITGLGMGANTAAGAGGAAAVGSDAAAIQAANDAWLAGGAAQPALAGVGAGGTGAGLGAAGAADTAAGAGAGAGGGALGAAGYGGEMAGGEFGIPLSGGGLGTGGAAAAGSGGAAGAGAGTATGGLGAVAGGALGVAGIAAPVIAGLRSSPVALTSKYWDNLSNAVSGKGSGNATYDKNTSVSIQRENAFRDILNIMQQGTGSMGHTGVPPALMALANKYGFQQWLKTGTIPGQATLKPGSGAPAGGQL